MRVFRLVVSAAGALRRFARGRVVLCVSALCALASMAAVPPDAAYIGYFDVRTLACLFCILAVVQALRGAGALDGAARALVTRFRTPRAAVLALVGATVCLSMVATNDMALVMMLPLATATLARGGLDEACPPRFHVAKPRREPRRHDRPLRQSAEPVPVLVLLFGRRRVRPRHGAAVRRLDGARVRRRVAGSLFTGLKRVRARPPPSTLRTSRGARWPLTWRCSGWLSPPCSAPCPPLAVLAVVAAVLALADRSALRRVDYALLLTFCCFFVFSGIWRACPRSARRSSR